VFISGLKTIILNLVKHPVFILLVLLILPHLIFAAPPTFNDDVDDVPIDSGMAILAGAGLIMGGWGYIKKKSSSGN
jgi:hypothetical protein